MARSVVKSVFFICSPSIEKKPKNHSNGHLSKEGLFWMVFGLLLLTGVSNKKKDFTMLLATLKPLDRHPTCLCLNKLFSSLYYVYAKTSNQN